MLLDVLDDDLRETSAKSVGSIFNAKQDHLFESEDYSFSVLYGEVAHGNTRILSLST